MSPLDNEGAHDDPLYDVQLEESVLSTMMMGTVVRSPGLEAFTSPARRLLYELLRISTPYPKLEAALRKEGYKEDEIAYVADVFLVPGVPAKGMLEAVNDLKRLALLRRLCGSVDSWRRRAPTLSFDRAVRELGAALRGGR
jgi:hypothetical protein